jgi:hypothetical protein
LTPMDHTRNDASGGNPGQYLCFAAINERAGK